MSEISGTHWVTGMSITFLSCQEMIYKKVIHLMLKLENHQIIYALMTAEKWKKVSPFTERVGNWQNVSCYYFQCKWSLYFWIYYWLAVSFWKNHFTSPEEHIPHFRSEEIWLDNFPVHLPSKSCVVQTVTLCVGLEADNKWLIIYLSWSFYGQKKKKSSRSFFFSLFILPARTMPFP